MACNLIVFLTFYRLNSGEFLAFVFTRFEDDLKGKSEESKQMISTFIKQLSKDLMILLDTRKENTLDVRLLIV